MTREVRAAREADAEEQRLELHDMVPSTLTVLARGGSRDRDETMRRRARQRLCPA